jgi:hypothetical protein
LAIISGICDSNCPATRVTLCVAASTLRLTPAYACVCCCTKPVIVSLMSSTFSIVFRMPRAVSSVKASCTRAERASRSSAMRAPTAVSCVMSGRLAPGSTPAPLAVANSRSTASGDDMEMMFACQSPKSDAGARTTAGCGGRMRSGSISMLTSTPSPCSVSSIAVIRPFCTPRCFTGLPTRSSPT